MDWLDLLERERGREAATKAAAAFLEAHSPVSPPSTEKPKKKRTKNFQHSYASNTRVKFILIASDPQPREEELRAVRLFFFRGGGGGGGGEIWGLRSSLLGLCPLTRKETSLLQKKKKLQPKQVFKRIHAAFVEASCNPFYTADSVSEGKRESEKRVRNKAQRKRERERREREGRPG